MILHFNKGKKSQYHIIRAAKDEIILTDTMSRFSKLYYITDVSTILQTIALCEDHKQCNYLCKSSF